MRISAVMLLIVSTALAVTAVSAQTKAVWEKVDLADRGFEAIFPSKPETKFEILNTTGGSVSHTTFVSRFDGGDYLLTVTDMPGPVADARLALLRSQEGVVGSSGKIIYSTPTTDLGYAALDYKFRLNADGVPCEMTVHAVVAGQRLYQVAVLVLESRAAAPENARFLSSFRLKTPASVARR
jgi:hypothetical protein